MVAIPAELEPMAVAGVDPARYAIGGRRPEWIVAPRSVPEAIAVVKAAAAMGVAIAPLGRGTALGELTAPSRPFAGLLTQSLPGEIEHAAPDLTVVAGAGTAAADLALTLGRSGQRLPLWIPGDERGTVGGLVAGDRSGPLRLGHGTVRDYLIGITLLDARGRIVRAGGRVVKNVAGYDLMKLHTGARGTLGLILEAVFKVTPVPAVFAVATAGLALASAARVRTELARAQVPAVALELAMDPESRVGELAVAVEGVPSEVDWQLARVDEAMRAAGATPGRVLAAEAASGLLRQIAAFGGEGEGASRLRVRGAVLPARVPELIAAWREAVPAARVVAGIGSGIVRLAVPAEKAAPVVTALRTAAAALGGHARVEALPAGGEIEEVDRFGVAPDPLALRLKAALDPGGLWLPGSYLGLGGAVA